MSLMKLWKLNERTGYWDYQRSFEDPTQTLPWLAKFQELEPQATFKVSTNKPTPPALAKAKPKVALTPSFPEHWSPDQRQVFRAYAAARQARKGMSGATEVALKVAEPQLGGGTTRVGTTAVDAPGLVNWVATQYAMNPRLGKPGGVRVAPRHLEEAPSSRPPLPPGTSKG
jgi:hypothetical protein